MTFENTLVNVSGLMMPSIGQKKEITYLDIKKTPADYCVQCFFSGGKWSSSKCMYKASLTLKEDQKFKMSTKMTYKDMFNDLAACKTGKAPTHLGSQPKYNQFKVQETQHTNCINGYNGDNFADGIPTEQRDTGFNFTFKWRKDSKKGDWCYISQPLPAGYSGGLIMNFSLSTSTEFAMKITTYPKVMYFNNASISKYVDKNNTIPMIGTSQIEIYYMKQDDKDDGFSIQFSRNSAFVIA